MLQVGDVSQGLFLIATHGPSGASDSSKVENGSRTIWRERPLKMLSSLDWSRVLALLFELFWRSGTHSEIHIKEH